MLRMPPTSTYGQPPIMGEPKNLGPFVRHIAAAKPRKPGKPTLRAPKPGIPDLPPGAAVPGASTDPFAATPPSVLQSQAAQQIQAIYNPIIQQLKDAAQAAITSGSNAITGYTGALADRLGSYAPASRQSNAAAAQSLAALEAAAGQQLRGEGSSLAGELGKQLAQINAPNAQAVTSNLTNTANNAATADYASNNAQLQSLVEQGQHAADYIDKLPGIASLTGLQNIRDLTASTNQQLATQLGQTSAQIPSAVQSLLGQMQSNELSKAQERERVREFNVQQQDAKASAAAAANKPTIFGSGTSGYYALNPATGKMVQLTEPGAGTPKVFGDSKSGYYTLSTDGKVTQLTTGLGATGGSGGSSHYQSKTINGHTVVYDPSTGSYYLPTGQQVDPNTFKKPPKPLDASIQRDIVADIRTNKQGGTQVMTADEAATQPKDWEQKALPNGKVQVTIPPLVDASKDDPRINSLYKEILGQYGINEQTAFKMVSKVFPGWAARNQRAFFGTQPGQPAQAPTNEPAVGLKNRTAVLSYARQLAQKQYGWGPSEWASLETLWNNESGWNFQAQNPKSGALGIPQALGHALPPGYANDPAVQIQWGMNYIKQRYGTPSKALAFWYSTKPPGEPQGHWY